MTTTTDDMHPAADVLRSRLLTEVGEENRRLGEEIGGLSRLVEHLGSIDIRLASRRAVPASLNDAFVVNNYNGLPCLCVPLDASPWYLSEFMAGEVWMSGQRIGAFPPAPLLSVADDDKVMIKALFSQSRVIVGELRGLDDDDRIFFKDNTSAGEQKLMEVLATGRGLRNAESLVFAPHTMFFIISEDLRETIRVLGPLPTYKREEDLYLEPLLGDCVKGPPPSRADESRLAVAGALGCADAPLLEENRNLKILRHRLSKIEEWIGAVELHHDLSCTSLSINDGEKAETLGNGTVWRVSLKIDGGHLPIVANNLHLLELTVSGVRCGMKRMELHIDDETGLRYFTGTFDNEVNILGFFDAKSCPEMTDDGVFAERARGYLSGEQTFPPSFTLMAGYLNFSLETAHQILGVLLNGEY